MDIRTKVISTLIAMVCSMSVSATGVVAILLEYPVSTQTSFIALSEVAGDLWGERYGANDEDLVLQHLYVSGVGIAEETMDYFTEDVEFSNGSTEMEFVFKFILARSATSGVKINFDSATLTNPRDFSATYQYAYGQAEPNWEESNELIVDNSYVVDEENPYIWLRMRFYLDIDMTRYMRFMEPCTWSFSITFSGLSE